MASRHGFKSKKSDDMRPKDPRRKVKRRYEAREIRDNVRQYESSRDTGSQTA